MIRSIAWFALAGLFEIGGGYLVWLWLREHYPFWVGLLGFIALMSYGVVPVFQPSVHSFGRIYAAYGAVFIVMSVLWGWGVDGRRPDTRDWVGAAVCLVGMAIMMGHRGLAAK